MMLLVVPIIFFAGYLFITLEHSVKINKAATALLTAVLCWTAYTLSGPDVNEVSAQLLHHMGEIAGILFFLLGAMTIVELIDAYDGFEIIINQITTTNKRTLLWIVSLLTFFLSAVLDNLTTSIVMVSLVRKLLDDKKERALFLGIVIIAANAGGAWSPIGDVTTTMLWIGGQVTSSAVVTRLLLPGLVCMVVPVTIASLFFVKGSFKKPAENNAIKPTSPAKNRNIIFFSGLGILVLVPAFKTFTHLPPFMGMLLGLGILWVITEMLHGGKDEEDKHALSMVYALRKIDSPSILFFLGILLAIASLEATGQLSSFAAFLQQTVNNENALVMLIGLFSAVVDNVPLVAGAMGMYSLSTFPTDHNFWLFLAYCAGTGGSTLIIGSVAGVAVMGMEKIDFFWYVKNISLLALAGYLAGAMVYLAAGY